MQESVREFVFVRHGETHWNVEQRLQGLGDSPLTERGRAQVAAHLPWLRTFRPERLVASPLGRTMATAGILALALELPVEPEPALRERCMGRFEGWTLDEVRASEPEIFAERERSPWSFRAPGGENYDDLLARVSPFLDRLVAAPEARLLLVAHGTVVRPMLGHLLGLPRSTILRIHQPNDLIYRVKLGAAESSVERWHAGRAAEGLLLAP